MQAKIIITVEGEQEFTNEEIAVMMKDIQARLQGYYTKTPECMKKTKMSIAYEKAN